jgi:hypothetical protein
MNATARRGQAEQPDTAPVDIETIKRSAEEVISDGAKIEDSDVLETIIILLRGMIMLLVSEVEKDLARYARNNSVAIGARAGITEARVRAHAFPGSDIPQLVGHAQRLARGVLALIRHHERLGGAA